MIPLYCSQRHENSEGSRFCRECGERLEFEVAPLYSSGSAGEPLGLRYRVLRELGQGGFGRTYLAEDTNRFHELCVLKEFAPQVQGTQALQKAEELFEREAGILYKLQHPQIPRFRELFRAELAGKGRLFLVQDYVEGQTYQAILRSRRNLGQSFTEAEVTQVLFQLLPVLSYIHASGVIHRDISPDNLILRSSDGLPVLIDFGGVKQVAAEVAFQFNPPGVLKPPAGVTLLGKVGYAPEEQLLTGEVFPHSDLYALAVLVLVLATGKEPQTLLGNRRQWQQEVSLSSPLMSILERMLDLNPLRRFQSAQDVLQVLHEGVPALKPSGSTPDYDVTRAPVEYAQVPGQNSATIASFPAPHQESTQEFSSAPTAAALSPISHRGSRSGTLFKLLLIVGLIGSGLWAGDRWLKPLLTAQNNTTKPIQPTPSPTTNNSTVDPGYPPAEQSRKQVINKRQEALGIDHTFLISLVNQEFYARHPDLSGRQLSTGAADEALRTEWDKIANQRLDRLQSLTSEARSRLGRYTETDVKERQAAVNQLNLSSRALNDLTDAQFFHLFPEQPREQTLLDQPIGQVWQAIAADQLKSLQSANALETIQFPSGRFSQQVAGNLKPGQGKAYLARFTKDQAIRLKLQSSAQSIRLSFYPPTSKSPPLLADSQANQWSGKLPASGLYEVVVVSAAQEEISYELSLAAADEITVSEDGK
jgi:serine/threonine-protein kinase